MIIGINGKIGAGKDTLGMILQALTFTKYPGYKGDPLEYLEMYEGRPNHKDDGAVIRKFADKLKEIASMLTGIPRGDFEKQEVKDMKLGEEWTVERGINGLAGPKGKYATYDRHYSPLTVREFLQKLGTDAMRFGLHKDVWVNALFADYRVNPGMISLPDWIITDVRFPNEAQRVKDMGGIMVRVERPDNPFPQSTHESETALDSWKFDHIVTNESKEGLVEVAKQLLTKVG
jgi:hypothetical protein